MDITKNPILNLFYSFQHTHARWISQTLKSSASELSWGFFCQDGAGLQPHACLWMDDPPFHSEETHNCSHSKEQY